MENVALAAPLPASPPLSGHRRLFRGSLISIGASLAIQGVAVVSGVILARSLGPVGKGELTAVLLWPGLLSAVGSLGLGDAVVYFTARQRGREREIAATGFLFTLTNSAILVAVGAFLTTHFLSHYGSSAVAAGLVNLASIPVYALASGVMCIFQGRLQFGILNALRLSAFVGPLAGLLGLVATNRLSVINVVYVTLGASCLTTMGALWMLGRRGWLGLRPDIALVKPLLIYGLKSHTGNISGLINARADQAIISLFMAPAFLGLYSIAVSITGFISLLTTPIGQVAFPAVAEGGSPAERAHRVSEFVRASFIISALSAAALIVASPLLIHVLFGSAFLPATEATEVLLVAAVILGVNRVLGDALRGLNSPLVPGIAEGIAAVVTLISLVLLLPVLGIVGAAVASLLAYATSLVCMMWFCSTRFGISPAALLVPRKADFLWLRNRLADRLAILRGQRRK